jgi:hypothetical protein
MSSTYEKIRRLADLTSPTRESLRELEREWEQNPPPFTVAMGTVGRSLASEVGRISRDELRAVFDLAENFLVGSDEETKTAVATGFLESLLAQASAGRLDFRRIGPMLGDESRKYCREWDRFTGVVTEGLDNPGDQT